MKTRSLYLWLSIAVCFSVLVLVQRQYAKKPSLRPQQILSSFKAAEVTSIQIRPHGQLEMKAVRTNNTWRLVEPFDYPAQSYLIDTLLAELERLTPAVYITPAELKAQANADEEFGFKSPTSSILLSQGNKSVRLLVGARTAPGDQVFLQVVGVGGVNIVDAELLGLLPRNANDFRDTTFIDLKDLAFDRIAVSNGPRIFELQREGSGPAWRMVRPIDARADSERINELVQQLQKLRVLQFASDDPGTDLETFGLQSPELALTFRQDTNVVAELRFGRSPTNDITQVYAYRPGQRAIVAVSRELLVPWRGSVNDFRDPHLVSISSAIEQIDVNGLEDFSLRRQTNGAWIVKPEGYAADSLLVQQLLVTLGSARIVEFTKDVVTAMDLPTYGLADPLRKYTLKVGSPEPGTNRVYAQLNFGTNTEDRVYVRRTDESSVYAIELKAFEQLPALALQMRERQIWDINEDDLAGVTIEHKGKKRQLLRSGRHQWSLAPGSQGIINELAIEESVKQLCRLAALGWVAHGVEHKSKLGFSEDGYRLTLDLKRGEKLTFQVGAAIDDTAFGAVTLGGELWIFEMPPATYRFLATYLTIPGDV